MSKRRRGAIGWLETERSEGDVREAGRAARRRPRRADPHPGAGQHAEGLAGLDRVPVPHLDDKHTIFGEVTEGMDTVKALEKAGSPDRSGRTLENLKIVKATIRVD